MTPTQLVQNVLLGGGVTATNITFTGSPNMPGAFTNGNTTNIGLTSGVLLTTGNITNVPQSAFNLMSDGYWLPGDADLDNLTTGGTHDACVLQFDFTPLGDTIKFRYVFGSEEYPEYVCSVYNDVFGFFLSGPNPSGGTYNNINLAKIPGTNLPVAINSVNPGSPGMLSGGGNCSGTNQSLSYTNFYINNQWGTTIVFDGFTKVLTAWCKVTPCQTYHIKLAVTDVGDDVLDSGVFLEAYSFSSSGTTITPTYSNLTLGNNAVEGCSDGIFAFTTSQPLASPLTINFTVGGTATSGTDYTSIPNSITIPAGQDSAAIVIDALQDNITEGTETVTITVSGICSSTQVYTINIVDNSALSVTTGGATTICSGGTATLTTSVNGGASPYSYNWNNGGGTGSTATVSPTSTTTYIVTVTDNCGQTGTDDVTVTVGNSLTVAISPVNPNICPGANVLLTASGGTTFNWSPSTGLSSTSGANVTANPTATTTYTVSSSDVSGCSGSANVTVNVNPISATASSTDENCGQSDGTVTATPQGTCTQGYTYLWNTLPSQTTQTATNLSSGIYTVTVSCDACTTTATVTVSNIAGPSVSIANIIDDTCDMALGGATAIVTGGSTPYIYEWNTTPQQTGATLNNVIAGVYYVTVTDSNNCTAVNTVTISNIPTINTSTSSTDAICDQANGTAEVTATGGNGNYTYEWGTNPPQSTSIATGLYAGTYVVTVSDGACITTAMVTINDIPGPTAGFSAHPNVLTPFDGPVSCLDNSSGNIITWEWDFGDGTTGMGSEIQHTYGNLGAYIVTLIVTDMNGCKDTVSDTIIVKDIFTFYIPNAFIPDENEKNDLFSPQGVNVDPDNFEMTIYDRWGNVMFHTKKWHLTNAEGWNGTKDNKGTIDDVVMGVYVYCIIVKEIEGPKHQYIGRITLIK